MMRRPQTSEVSQGAALLGDVMQWGLVGSLKAFAVLQETDAEECDSFDSALHDIALRYEHWARVVMYGAAYAVMLDLAREP